MTILMRKHCSFIFSALILSISSITNAKELYYGLNFSTLDYKETTTEQMIFPVFSMQTISGKLGRVWNDNFSAEMRVGFGLNDDEKIVSVNGTLVPIQLGLKNFYGAYVKIGEQVKSNIYPYTILGYTRVKGKVKALFIEDTNAESDSSFGMGIDFDLTETLKLNIEYMNYLDKNTAALSGFSIGLISNF
jgi:outer membrane immunogenic protein